MKRIFLFLATLIFLITTSACSDKPGILFYKNPVTDVNVMNYESVFKPNVRIYYLIMMPEKVHSRFLYIQIVKKNNKEGRFGYKLYQTRNIRLKDEELNYYTDYMVISEPGVYFMQVYSKDDPQTPLSKAQFYVQ